MCHQSNLIKLNVFSDDKWFILWIIFKVVNLDGDPAVIAGYLNETKLLAKLQGNINVVALFGYQHMPEKRQLIMVM